MSLCCVSHFGYSIECDLKRSSQYSYRCKWKTDSKLNTEIYGKNNYLKGVV